VFPVQKDGLRHGGADARITMLCYRSKSVTSRGGQNRERQKGSKTKKQKNKKTRRKIKKKKKEKQKGKERRKNGDIKIT
jgi:hypothetical protein